MIYGDFLPRALTARSFLPSSPAKVVRRGLKARQAAVETLKTSVFAAKVVVALT